MFCLNKHFQCNDFFVSSNWNNKLNLVAWSFKFWSVFCSVFSFVVSLVKRQRCLLLQNLAMEEDHRARDEREYSPANERLEPKVMEVWKMMLFIFQLGDFQVPAVSFRGSKAKWSNRATSLSVPGTTNQLFHYTILMKISQFGTLHNKLVIFMYWDVHGS